MNELLKEIYILYRNTSVEGVLRSGRFEREPEVNHGRCTSTCKPNIILIGVGGFLSASSVILIATVPAAMQPVWAKCSVGGHERRKNVASPT